MVTSQRTPGCLPLAHEARKLKLRLERQPRRSRIKRDSVRVYLRAPSRHSLPPDQIRRRISFPRRAGVSSYFCNRGKEMSKALREQRAQAHAEGMRALANNNQPAFDKAMQEVDRLAGEITK